eukprot:331982-Rhodomonas_salina.1
MKGLLISEPVSDPAHVVLRLSVSYPSSHKQINSNLYYPKINSTKPQAPCNAQQASECSLCVFDLAVQRPSPCPDNDHLVIRQIALGDRRLTSAKPVSAPEIARGMRITVGGGHLGVNRNSTHLAAVKAMSAPDMDHSE